MIQVLLAQGQGGDPAGGAGGGLFGNPYAPLFIIGMFVLFWVVVILPASRRQKREQEQMLATLKRGSKVVTSAGIIGIIVGIKDGDEEVTIRSDESKLKVLRSTIIRVIGSDESEAAK
jgi:preprotein translocase subunit YajC